MRRKTGGGEEGTVETLAPKYIIPPHREKERKKKRKKSKKSKSLEERCSSNRLRKLTGASLAVFRRGVLLLEKGDEAEVTTSAERM